MTTTTARDRFTTDTPCPRCHEMLVDITSAGDRAPVMMCTQMRCVDEPLYTFEAGILKPFCAVHNMPLARCKCAKDGDVCR